MVPSLAPQFRRILKPSGSLVIDIGGAWIPGQPTRSLYHYELLLMLCKEIGFHLAQEFFWWSPSKLPTPAEWVTVRRIRVKDAVNCVWWLSSTPWPKASNRRVLAPYSDAMKNLLKNGYKAKLRPSGHDISKKFSIDNKASIPPNLIASPTRRAIRITCATARSTICRDIQRAFRPAPECLIRCSQMLETSVLEPFSRGSCVTGEVAERLNAVGSAATCRRLFEGGLGRFERRDTLFPSFPNQRVFTTSSIIRQRCGTAWTTMIRRPTAAGAERSRSQQRIP